MRSDDFPALYRSADESSVGAQSAYLWLIKGQYSLLIGASVVALWFDNFPELHFVYAVVITIASVLLLYMSLKKPEKDWYNCRALAESVKTSTWRYMMRAEPFGDTPKLAEAKQRFASFLRAILESNKHIGESISRRPVAGEQITEVMDEVRASPLERRKAYYGTERITDQLNWYIAKVRINRRQFRIWIALCVAVQGTAIGLALLRVRYDFGPMIWPTEPLLVLASSLVGWIQIKKFNELASAYSLAAHEIGIIRTRIEHVSSEEEFSEFVNDAERAFSREHTQWVARQVHDAE